jgi:hypothetical protein
MSSATLTALTPKDQAAYDYICRETSRERGWGARETKPYGGLTIATFRIARIRLADKGLIVLAKNGRWVPTAALGEDFNIDTITEGDRAA